MNGDGLIGDPLAGAIRRTLPAGGRSWQTPQGRSDTQQAGIDRKRLVMETVKDIEKV